jgi:hypothetical protein
MERDPLALAIDPNTEMAEYIFLRAYVLTGAAAECGYLINREQGLTQRRAQGYGGSRGRK